MAQTFADKMVIALRAELEDFAPGKAVTVDGQTTEFHTLEELQDALRYWERQLRLRRRGCRRPITLA